MSKYSLTLQEKKYKELEIIANSDQKPLIESNIPSSIYTTVINVTLS